MFEYLRLILLSFVFLGLLISLFFYFYFYRKYSAELSKSFHFLSDRQCLDVNDYLFYEQLGLPGFAHRVLLMKKILSGKATTTKGKIILSPEVSQLIASTYNFSWIKTFYKMTIFVAFLMLLLLLMVATGK
ncbi:hypothetical protein Q0A17_14250 [Citrobacter sp. S2-9]|uniref:Uncharacterized protein n=1 Tax=Citrobacter enshiensis TaxID=2971264 RepID=A0ABT8PX50_9ENTR|nr:hypothetical protein [Citrobacter enshiensis]MDN8600562.1 hypothetical protein [Citrobacter enshiensis]